MLDIKVGDIITIGTMNFRDIEGGFGEGKKSILAKDIANIHNKEFKHINEAINKNRYKFTYGLDIVDLKGTYLETTLVDLGIYTQQAINRSKNIYLLSLSGYLKLADSLQNSPDYVKDILEYFKYDGDCIKLNKRHELEFIDKLKTALIPFNLHGTSQYSVFNYRVDFYIPSLKIAIEYDENSHKNYTWESHEGRQQEIEKELGCRFIRVSDKNSDEYNIGLVIKEIFNL